MLSPLSATHPYTLKVEGKGCWELRLQLNWFGDTRERREAIRLRVRFGKKIILKEKFREKKLIMQSCKLNKPIIQTKCVVCD